MACGDHVFRLCEICKLILSLKNTLAIIMECQEQKNTGKNENIYGKYDAEMSMYGYKNTCRCIQR